jgi:phosphoribosylanthranilate isomerase
VEDAELAVRLGADYIGAVRTSGSPRRVSLGEARTLFAEVGARAARVLVFRGAAVEEVLSDAVSAGADWVQLYHASEADVRRVESEGLRVLRVVDVTERATELPAFPSRPTSKRPALLDVGGGGSGRRFDWEILGARAPAWTFVAGGIRPDNVADLIDHRPYGIDLSSGVESEPGVKDARKLRALFERIESKP